MVGGAEEYLGWDRRLLGWLPSAEMLGVSLASLGLFIFSNRISLRSAVIIGLSGMFLMNAICISVPSPEVLISLRFIAGLCGGMAYTGAISFLARIPNTQVGYSNYIIIYSILSGTYLLTFPYLLKEFGYQAGYVVLTIQVGLALFFIRYAMGDAKEYTKEPKVKDKILGQLNLLILAVLGLFIFFQMGNAGIYSFAERLGNEYGISTGVIGAALSASIFIGIPVGSLNIYLARHMNSPQMIRMGLLIMLVAIIFLWNGSLWSWHFVAGIIMLEGGFSMVLPNVFSWLASFDLKGRWVTFGTILNWLGQGIGPLIAASMAAGESYELILVFPALFFIIGLALTYVKSNKKAPIFKRWSKF